VSRHTAGWRLACLICLLALPPPGARAAELQPAAVSPAAAAPLAAAPAPATSPAAPAATPQAAASAPPRFDLKRPEIAAFMRHQVELGWNRAELRRLLRQAEPQPKILEAIAKPAEKALQWWEYRPRFMTHERIDAGARIWREHRAELADAASRYGVDPEYLLAIVGVETYYGRITGRYRVLDALATLTFDYPPRAEFFRKELEQFLQLARAGELDPLATQGSYAGAMGATQFMPSSFRRYAVHGTGTQRPDLWSDWSDIFDSVGNYMHAQGWAYGQPVLAEVELGTAPEPPPPAGVALDDTLGALRARGMQVASTLADDTPCVLVAAPLENGSHWRVGFQNFRVITRYNRSPLYAMAVHDLAEALAARMREADAP